MNITAIRLREERQKLKLSQAAVADQLNLTRPAYVKYETGSSTPQVKTLSKLAEMFGVSTDYLLGKTDKRNTLFSSPSPSRQLTLAEKEQAIKEWLTAIAQAAGNEKALAAIERIKLVESTGQLHLEDGSDLDNALLQLQATSLLNALEKAQKEGTGTAEWHVPQGKK